MIAFLFPGQGSQKVGMGKALAEAFRGCRAVFDEADAALGEPLSRLCFEGPEDRLHADREHAAGHSDRQRCGRRLLLSRGVQPAFLAGHSLGEYSAHVVAGTLDFSDAVRIVRRRGQLHAGGRSCGHGCDGRDSRR